MSVPPTPENLRLAVEILRRGGLVAMPTETVYGLAADATNPDAIRKVFAAKGRPADNPLIVHIADMATLRLVAKGLPPYAAKFAERFWPGPLTLVLPKTDAVPSEVTGGLDTVAVRMPDHEVALALIRESGLPLAAPSANRFMQLSPTQASHVEDGLAELVLDGGPCRIGVESTVVDCTGAEPRILRPGGVSRADLTACLGRPLAAPPEGPRRSPGMYAKHYAPKASMQFVDELGDSPGLGFDEPKAPGQIQMPRNAVAYGALLYAALHRLDAEGHATIFIQRPPDGPEWETVWDRLQRASGTR